MLYKHVFSRYPLQILAKLLATLSEGYLGSTVSPGKFQESTSFKILIHSSFILIFPSHSTIHILCSWM